MTEFNEPFTKESIMQECVEGWLTFWIAKPIAWAIFAVWIALMYTWIGGVRCVSKVRGKWTTWRSRCDATETPVVHAEPRITATTRRASKRQAA